MRTIAVVTVGRSDYGIYYPVLREICARPALKLHLIVGGMHLSPAFGETFHAIEADGFQIGDRVEVSPASDSPELIAKAMGAGTAKFAEVLARVRPDILVVLGDRYEMHAAAVAAVPLRIPIAHVHGGELTQGAIDDVLRHSITKMSHLHFASTEDYGRRIAQMGEQKWRIVVSGAPSLDNLREFKPSAVEDFKRHVGMRPNEDFLLVTYHPETLDATPVAQRFENVLNALKQSERELLFTMANADSGGQTINQMIRDFVGSHSNARLVENLGKDYFSALAYATAMVGNSSSGIIEAASFRLPVVNIGARQQGRIAGANVINTGYDVPEIAKGIDKASSTDFRKQIAAMQNPYGDGTAAKKIVDRLESVPIDSNLITKKFNDL